MGLARLLQPEDFCRPIRPIAADDMPRSAVPDHPPIARLSKACRMGTGSCIQLLDKAWELKG